MKFSLSIFDYTFTNYTTIWKIYFEEDLSQKDLLGMLTDLLQAYYKLSKKT
ncbi:hypothetical protein [Coleofasciculus sp. E2-BRE-01]|uniref:hypothetical protein n=1 Tax=Coleofasciculus sp. E2-BRE-01 TaxID=3069524 RepID=UPI003300B6F5